MSNENNNDKVNEIRITFPHDVDVSSDITQEIVEITDKICKENTPEGHVMWPAGVGGLMTSLHVPDFDMSVLAIDVSCREAHPDEIENYDFVANKRVEIDQLKRYTENHRIASQVIYDYIEEFRKKDRFSEKDLEAFNKILIWIASEISGFTDKQKSITKEIMKKFKEESEKRKAMAEKCNTQQENNS